MYGVMDRWLWPHAAKMHGYKWEGAALTWLVGMVERFTFTAALIIPSAWQWIGVWLAMKAIVRWQSVPSTGEAGGKEKFPSKQRDSDNIWLIGTALSVVIGFVGAWIALGHLPLLGETAQPGK